MLKKQALALKPTLTHTMIIQSHLPFEYNCTYSNESPKQGFQKFPGIAQDQKYQSWLKMQALALKPTFTHAMILQSHLIF